MWSRKNKNISFFVVLDRENEQNFLTLTCDKEDAFDFAYKFIKIKNLNHFNMWCDLRGLDKNSDQAWNKYYIDCVSIEEKQKYIIRKITYKLKDVSAILRMFGGCLPLGCKFDTEQEYNYLKYKLETQQLAQNLTNQLQDLMEKAKQEGENKDGE